MHGISLKNAIFNFVKYIMFQKKNNKKNQNNLMSTVSYASSVAHKRASVVKLKIKFVFKKFLNEGL